MEEVKLLNPTQMPTKVQAKVSVRVDSLGRAFKNYRRTILHKLRLAKRAKDEVATEMDNQHWTDGGGQTMT